MTAVREILGEDLREQLIPIDLPERTRRSYFNWSRMLLLLLLL